MSEILAPAGDKRSAGSASRPTGSGVNPQGAAAPRIMPPEFTSGEQTEILAPAGGEEQLVAAVRCGAGAVYLGAKGFNARRNAKNFDETSLPAAVRYCHERGVRLYVTVNTMILDEELPMLEEEAALIAQSGADAVIVQDMAVLRLFRNRYPSIARYASTQTAVHNVDGAKRLADMGFDGVVLAREMTLSEMEKVCAAVPVRMEAFVHGAHCMSLSGGCYLSAMLGGRSGNRGLCAQPCRLDWHCGGRDHCLSLKDMSLLQHVREMEQIGVDSFKIEGRMKRPEYVAAAVTACRQALAGEPYDLDTLRAVFSRSGFSDGYLTGKRDASMFGYRTKDDVTGAEGVLKELARLYDREQPLIPVSMRFEADAAHSALTVSDGTHEAAVGGAVPEAARTRALDAESAKTSLSKTGGTPYYVQNIDTSIADGLMLPNAALNALRRDALAALTAQRGETPAHEAQPFAFPQIAPHSPATPVFWGRFYKREQIANPDFFAKILLPAETVTAADIAAYGDKLIAELPAVLYPEREAAFGKTLEALRDAGLTAVMADNIYGAELGHRLGLTVYGGFGLNIANSQSLDEYARQGLAGVTLSMELNSAKLRRIGGELPRGILAYGYLPLMRWRNCPVKAAVGCAECRQSGSLTDRMGVAFSVECGNRNYSTLLNSVPLHIADRLPEGMDWYLLYFTGETPAEVRRVTEDYALRRKSDSPRTGGLYNRELL